MPGDHDWPEIGARSGPTSAVDAEICHTEGDGPCHSAVKPAPFTRRRVMASSPWGSWVAVEACAPGTVRVFRGVPASTADGPTAYAPITDRHGSELTLDARPETIPGETIPEAHVLAMAIVPLDKEDKEEGRSDRGATVVVMTAEELRLFAIRRGDSGPGKEYFECAASASGRLSHDTFLGRDRGRLVGVAADDVNVAVVASRVARVLFRVNRFDVRPEKVMHDCSLPNGQTLKGVFHAEPRDGPVVACALLDSETRARQTSTPGTVAALGFAKEIRVVRFVNEGYEVLHRVLVDAPGPVRSIAVHGGWLFASTEFQTALPSTFRDGNHFAREPVNFAFQNAARFAGEGTKASSETAIQIGDDGRDAQVETPFLRARLDPAEKTKRLQDMVQPFLPAELRGSLPPAEVSEGSEGVKEAERRDPRATLQAFALEDLQNAFEDEDDEEEEDAFVAARLSLPLAPTARRPEICALQSLHEGRDGRKSGYVVALTDVGASTGASVAVAELVRGSRRDFRLVARGTASLQTRSDAKTETETETKTKPRVEAFGRIARFLGARKSAGAKAFGLDVVLLTSETNDSETPNADAGFRIFGGGSTKKKKPAPPASLATIRVSLDVTRRSRAVSGSWDGPTSAPDDAPFGSRAPSISGVPTTPSSSRREARRTNEGEALNPPEAPRLEPPELSDPRGRATDFERVLDAIRALDGAVHDRFDRVEATLQIQERRLRRVEESLLKK
jgi:hypothetical protein